MARSFMIELPVALVVATTVAGPLASKETEKAPAAAGAFYPADPIELKQVVSAYLAAAWAKPVDGKLVALIAPHTGYPYSGKVAAHAFRYLTDRPMDTVILIGASHTAPYAGAAVYGEGIWRTPLGTVQINERIAKSLLNENTGIAFSPGMFSREHSLEVQLPFALLR
jgi:AmmeMemoRadiSam system protein B